GNSRIHIIGFSPRSTDGSLQSTRRHHAHHLLDIQAEASCRTIATEYGTHLVISATAYERIAPAGGINCEPRATVVRVPTQIGQIERNGSTFKTGSKPL